jgi:aromatic ring-opening dioxygenase catalytic subunit (LigB family)
MQCEEFRVLQGAGADSDLIRGYAVLRERIARAAADVVVIFDSHWFTTGYHLIDAGAHYQGVYTSDEMPWYLHGVPYDYKGHPALALAIETVSRECRGYHRLVNHPDLSRHYATINLVKQLRLEHSATPVLSVSSCQNCDWRHYLSSGESIGEAIRRSGVRAVLLASGAMSHKFNPIDWKPNHARIFHESNVASTSNMSSDKQAIEFFKQGRHDLIIDRWQDEYRKLPWEAFGAHYLQMLGAMGGHSCRAQGETLSAYENARGTGNIHIWFETQAHLWSERSLTASDYAANSKGLAA